MFQIYGILAVINMYNDPLPSADPSINSINKSSLDLVAPTFSITTIKLSSFSITEYFTSLNLATAPTNIAEQNGIQVIQIIHKLAYDLSQLKWRLLSHEFRHSVVPEKLNCEFQLHIPYWVL